MSSLATAPTPSDILSYLAQHEQKELLRFLTCGSVDDGKSTLIGRLFYDAKMIAVDTLETLQKDSQVHGTTGGGFDPALFTDGLKAEREQGITIDVAYRYVSTERRKFIIADTPGHIQYTRNMATGASTANVGLILIDARLGVLQQSRRHAYIASLLGIPHLAVAVNKMDLVDWSQDVFQRICDEFRRFAAQLDFKDVAFVPVSALIGMNAMSCTSRRAAKFRKSASIARKRSSDQPTRSILFTANTRCGMRKSDAMNACRRDCSTRPWRASTRMIARFAVDAPVTMLRVYWMWPGVSAMMNLRRFVAK